MRPFFDIPMLAWPLRYWECAGDNRRAGEAGCELHPAPENPVRTLL